MKKNHNKGFSMIEMIIVIAIIGVFTGLASIGFGYIKSGNVKAAAQNLDSSLSKLKYDAMSKANMPYLYVYKTGGKYYTMCTAKTVQDADFVADNGELLCNGNCVITYDGGTALAEGKHIKIAYKKGSGGFSSSSDVKQEIVVENEEGTVSYTITIVFETGKHYVEQ